MSFLRSIFGPSKNEIWSQIAGDIGGDYIDGGFWGTDSLVYHYGEWSFVLDTYTVSSKNSSTTYTRMRAPFVNRDGLHFRLYRKGLFSFVGKFLGMQDIEIGDPFFDEPFIIKGNHPGKIRKLLAGNLKELIQYQPRILLQIHDDEGWFGSHFPEGVDELYFSCVGVMKETKLLLGLFELFSCALERLVQIDSAYEDDPNVRLL